MTQEKPHKKQRLWSFAKELWNDHDFWVRALAVKGGASAVVAGAVVAVSHVIALPLFLAVGGIALCSGLIALGFYGIVVGGLSSWEAGRDIYYRVVLDQTPPKHHAKKPLHLRVTESERVQRFLKKPLVKKFRQSRAWQMTAALSQKQRDLFITGLAGGGSLFWGIMSLLTLITQIVLLPVFTIGSLLTFGTVIVVGTLLSAIYGIYLTIQSLLRRKKK